MISQLEADIRASEQPVPDDVHPPEDGLTHRFEYMRWAPVIRDLYIKLRYNANKFVDSKISTTINYSRLEHPTARHVDYLTRKNFSPNEKSENLHGLLELVDALALVKTGELLHEPAEDIVVTLAKGDHAKIFTQIQNTSTILTGNPAYLDQDIGIFPWVEMPGFGLQVKFDASVVTGEKGQEIATATVSRLRKKRRDAARIGRKS